MKCTYLSLQPSMASPRPPSILSFTVGSPCCAVGIAHFYRPVRKAKACKKSIGYRRAMATSIVQGARFGAIVQRRGGRCIKRRGYEYQKGVDV